MSFRNTATDYGVMSRALHWIMALLLIGLFIAGEYMTGLPDEEKASMYFIHKSIGVLAGLFIVLRVVWRASTLSPGGVGSKIQKLAAKAVHAALYLVMIALPVSGVVMSMSGGHPVSFFGLYEFPKFIADSEFVHEVAESIHHGLAPAIAILFFVHVIGALYHHFIVKDRVMKRMIGAD